MKFVLLINLLLMAVHAETVLVSTTNPKNIYPKTKDMDIACSVIMKNNKVDNTNIVILRLKNKFGFDSDLELFKINESGNFLREIEWQDPKDGKYEKIVMANNVTAEQQLAGFQFKSDNEKIIFSNGNNCFYRESFKIKLSNGDLSQIKSVVIKDGVCPYGRLLLFGFITDIYDDGGYELKCVFNKN